MVAQKDVLDIKNKRLSSELVAYFQVCNFCRVVDQNNARVRVGYECPVCGLASKSGMMYFEFNIHSLVNLMQEAIHAEKQLKDILTKIDAHDISVVLFFCALREILLSNLIYELCRAQNIPLRVYKRLLSDNLTHTQRQEKLLPALIGKKLAQLMKEEKVIDLNDFLKKAADARNNFMHEGTKWDFNRALAEDCIRHIRPLLDFYVALHNKYVHPIFLEKIKKS